MTSPRALVLAAFLLAVIPAAAEGPSVMERLRRLFTAGRPIGFQVLFETPDTADDVDVNTTVAEVTEPNDPAARDLGVVTTSYRRDGVEHRFHFVIRDGELVQVELQRRAEDRWERAPPEVFFFKTNEDPPPPDLLGDGDAVLVARGFCLPGRGAPSVRSAVIVLRSFHTAAGQPPAW